MHRQSIRGLKCIAPRDESQSGSRDQQTLKTGLTCDKADSAQGCNPMIQEISSDGLLLQPGPVHDPRHSAKECTQQTAVVKGTDHDAQVVLGSRISHTFSHGI